MEKSAQHKGQSGTIQRDNVGPDATAVKNDPIFGPNASMGWADSRLT